MQLYSSNIIETDNTNKAIENILNYLKIKNILNNPDIKIVETPKGKTKIPIDETKKLREWISIKPYQEKIKLVIIKNAEYLGVDSQNTLLKTLEEPPEYATIVLITNSIKSLLDTVVSRCKIIKFEKENILNDSKFKLNLQEIINNDVKYSLDLVENVSKDIEGRKEAIEIIDNLEQQLTSLSSGNKPHYFQVLQKIKEDIETTNVSIKIALYKLILDLKINST